MPSILLDRKEHVIVSQTSQTLPRLCVYVDTETKLSPFRKGEYFHTLIVGCATFVDYQGKYPTDSIVFTTEDQFWEWVLAKHYKGHKIYIFAHNAAFDFRVMQSFSLLKSKGYYVHSLIAESNKFVCTLGNYKKEYNHDTLLHDFVMDGHIKGINSDTKKIKNKKVLLDKTLRKTLQVINTGNFFMFPLAKLGELLNLPKLEIKFNSASMDSLIVYCKRDVEILRYTMENYFRFIRTHHLGMFKPTIASQALCAFKTSFMKHKIYIHNNKRSIELERQSYCGGRTESFYIGSPPGTFHHKLDINSQYPYVMQQYEYPVKLVNHCELLTDMKRKHLLQGKQVIQYGRVTTEHPCVPVKSEGKLLFPIGRFYTALCQPEIDLLQELGGTFHPLKTSIYETAPIFTDYVGAMNRLKEEYSMDGNMVYRMLSKLFGTSLYGKFGQSTDIWTLTENTDEYLTEVFDVHDYKSQRFDKYKIICGDIYKYMGCKEGFDTFVAIASFITSHARVLLYRYILQAGQENVFYSDTDSLIVNDQGLYNLENTIDQHALGKLKLENSAKDLHIYGLKDYYFDRELKIKGIKDVRVLSKSNYIGKTRRQNKLIYKYKSGRMGYHELLTELETTGMNQGSIRKVISTFQTEQWEGFLGGVRNNRLETVLIKEQEKHLEREYSKGDVQITGVVQPHVLEHF